MGLHVYLYFIQLLFIIFYTPKWPRQKVRIHIIFKLLVKPIFKNGNKECMAYLKPISMKFNFSKLLENPLSPFNHLMKLQYFIINLTQMVLK